MRVLAEEEVLDPVPVAADDEEYADDEGCYCSYRGYCVRISPMRTGPGGVRYRVRLHDKGHRGVRPQLPAVAPNPDVLGWHFV